MRSAEIFRQARASLPVVPAELRRAIINQQATAADHAKHLAEIGALSCLEVRHAPRSQETSVGELRIAFWNAERCKYLGPSIDLLRRVDADVNLLCEMDFGMARSGQYHTTKEIAEALGQSYVFAAEFVELDLGDARERDWHAGEENSHGLHGAAIMSKQPIKDPALIRLDLDGAWFDGANGERRIGGRVAVAACIALAEIDLTAICVHFESHGDPCDRQRQMDVLLESVDRCAGSGPIVIGGDFNTNSAAHAELEIEGAKAAMAMTDPNRFVDPVRYEPLFEIAAAAGYDRRACNMPGPTQRMRPDGTPCPPFGRLDWFFTRGLIARNPAIEPAVDDAATAISDHELLAVSVSQAG